MSRPPDGSDVSRRYADLLDDPAAADLADVAAALDAYSARIEAPVGPPPTMFGVREETTMPVLETHVERPAVARPPAARRRGRRIFTDIGAVAAVLLISVAATVLLRGGFGGPGAVGPDAQLQLYSISMSSRYEGWAVGGQTWNVGRDDAEAGQVVLYHYRDNRWTPVYIPITDPDIPDGSHPVLHAVSMISPVEGWAAGSFTKGSVKAFFLHYDGSGWKEVDPAVPQSEIPYLAPGKPRVPAFADLSGLQMLSATDGWAAGGGRTQDGGFALLRYTGSAWESRTVDDPQCFEAMPMPQTYTCRFNGLDMVSPSEGWAVGASGEITSTQQQDGTQLVTGDTSAAVIAHYAGGRWSIEARFPHANLQRVAMVSATEGWAFGTQYTPGSDLQRPLLLRYAAGVWSDAASPLDVAPARASYIGTLTFTSATEGWLAVSEYAPQDEMAHERPILLHYSNGTWTRVGLPEVSGRVAYAINDLTMVSAQEGWAAGAGWLPPADGKLDTKQTGFDTPSRPLILHYSRGTWSVQVS